MQSYGRAINDSDAIAKKLLPTDRHPADDLCILSVMCLIKLSFIDNEGSIESIDDARASYILQATMLLEYAWSHSKPNFQISLLLIRLNSILGCGSLAVRAFEGLGIKQIQLDTLSYTIFDRISSLHPHPFRHTIQGPSEAHSPLENLDKQQRLYRKSRDHVSKNCWTSLENGTYSSVFQMKEFEETLNQSMSAVMSVVESRKIARLTQPSGTSATSSGAHDIFSKSDPLPC
jgi:N-terminal acetyltransferase B complex non-catalytic subunit